VKACAVAAIALLLAVCAGAARAAEPWTAAGTPAVLSQAVVFENAGAVLHGTLYRPAVAGRVPAVVAFHAANVSAADAQLYVHLRQGLPQMGIAVLVYDRRGTGQSTGKRNVSFETLADDGIAGARAIAQLPGIDPARIGYWGLSQGGWLAVFAAARDPRAAFAVSVSAPLVTPEAQMEFAMANVLRVNGYPQSDVDAMLAARTAWIGWVRGSVPRATAVAALAKIDAKPWFDLMYLPTSADVAAHPTDPSVRAQLDDDPLGALQRVRVPLLFVYGGSDPWIPVATTIGRLRPFAQTHANVDYAVVAGVDHDMRFVQHETMDVTPAALARDVPDAPAYFMLLASWLARIVAHTASP
jgi:uncharacterized protein